MRDKWYAANARLAVAQQTHTDVETRGRAAQDPRAVDHDVGALDGDQTTARGRSDFAMVNDQGVVVLREDAAVALPNVRASAGMLEVESPGKQQHRYSMSVGTSRATHTIHSPL